MTALQTTPEALDTLTLTSFIETFGEGLLSNIEAAHPPRFTQSNPNREAILGTLKRTPFEAQANAIQAICALLIDEQAPAGVINGEMGTGKVRRIGA